MITESGCLTPVPTIRRVFSQPQAFDDVVSLGQPWQERLDAGAADAQESPALTFVEEVVAKHAPELAGSAHILSVSRPGDDGAKPE